GQTAVPGSPPPDSPPPFLLLLLWLPHTPAPAMSCGPASRWHSAASPPAPPPPLAPCTSASALAGTFSTPHSPLALPLPLFPSLHTPPTACAPLDSASPSLSLPSFLYTFLTPLRSLSAR